MWIGRTLLNALAWIEIRLNMSKRGRKTSPKTKRSL